MLNNILDGLKRERAEFARDMEYLRETAIDDVIDERTEAADLMNHTETSDELLEAAHMLEKVSDEEDVMQESAEIDKIMNADENITFNEMVGIQ